MEGVDMLRYAIVASALALAAVSADPAAAQRVRAGVLTCDVSGGIGLIIGSQKQVSCVYAPDAPGAPQDFYTGSITKFGLDLGVTGASVMVWGVFSGTKGGPGLRAGDYVRATGRATVPARPRHASLVGRYNRPV